MGRSLATQISALLLFIVFPLAYISGSVPSRGVLIYAKASPSVVRLETLGTLFSGEQEISSGTGFVISDDGLILTCSHVVPDEKLYKTTDRKAYVNGNSAGSFIVVARNDPTDLALVKLKNPTNLQALPIGNSDRVQIGETLWVLGYPLNRPLSIVEGLLSNKFGGPYRWQAQTPLNPGNSGGPAFSPDGSVVAIAVGGVPKARIYQGEQKYVEVSVQGINDLIPVNIAKRNILSTLKIREVNVGEVTEEEELLRATETFVLPSKFNKSYALSEVNAHYSLFRENTRPYKKTFKAEPGYRIIKAVLVKLSATRVTDEYLTISEDRSQVHFQFQLTNGPFFNGYKGRLDASIETEQSLIE